MFFRSVTAKLLALFTLVIALVAIGPFVYFAMETIGGERERVTRRYQEVADAAAAAMLPAVWEMNADGVRPVLEVLELDEAVLRATVTEEGGRLWTSESGAEATGIGADAAELVRIRSTLRGWQFGEFIALGVLELVVDPRFAVSRAHDRLAWDAAIVIALTVGLGLMTAFAVERIVGRPLRLLTASMAHRDQAGAGTPVVWDAGDELGRTIRAYNAMLAEEKAYQQALIKARDQADMANRSKTSFLASMSHELRTPLNAILGFTELMTLPSLSDLPAERRQAYLNDIRAASLHLLDLINDVLEVTRIEAGDDRLQDREVDLGAMVGQAFRLLGQKAANRRVQLANDIPDGAVRLRADPRALKQVVLNLAGNAIKFSHEGGTVRAKAAARQEGGVDLVISDTGIGIAPEDLQKVRQPFWQANLRDHTLATADRGTGLGLALVDSLVQKHGGRMEIASTPELGTTVSCHFPGERILAPACPRVDHDDMAKA